MSKLQEIMDKVKSALGVKPKNGPEANGDATAEDLEEAPADQQEASHDQPDHAREGGGEEG